MPTNDATRPDEPHDGRPLAYLLGAPTASGKSEVALALAEAHGLEIVNADAMQVYRGLDVGTAKPSPADRARVPHHLIDIVEPSERFSVADWARRAEEAVLDAARRGRRTLVVGGTGFYLQALAEGLPTTPPADPAQQAPLWAWLEAEGREALADALHEVSPVDAARAGRNPRRLVRAWEVVRTTGDPPSAFGRTRPRVRVTRTWLVPSMDALAPRIEARTRAMLAGGLVEEAARLDMAALATASQAIGYAEAAALARGEIGREEAFERIVHATRRYARRQRTWFRHHACEVLRHALAPDVYPELAAWIAGAN